MLSPSPHPPFRPHQEPFRIGLCGTQAPLHCVVWACVPKCLEHQNNPVTLRWGLTALPLLYIAIKRVGDGVGWGRWRGGVGGKRYGAGEKRRRGVGDGVGDGVGFWVCACMW